MWNYTARPKVLSSKCLTDKKFKKYAQTKLSLNQLMLLLRYVVQ